MSASGIANAGITAGRGTRSKWRAPIFKNYRSPLQQQISICLLALVCAALWLPFIDGGASALPACCRADGKHHCMQPARAGGFHSASLPCPYHRIRILVSQGPALAVDAAALSISGKDAAVNATQQPGCDIHISESCLPRAPPFARV